MPEITFREALNQALFEEMERDPNVFVLGEDVGHYGGTYRVTEGLYSEFGKKRALDTPIAENGIIGMALGAAMVGLRPVAEIMSVNFILYGMDQIINHAAKVRYMFGGQVKVPMVVRTPGGGGMQLGCQHSQSLEVYFTHCPGLHVCSPSNPADAKGLLKTAIRDDNPIIFLEHELIYGMKGEVPDEKDFTVPLGQARIAREGVDLTIVSWSKMLEQALKTADNLAEEGIEATVIDPRTLSPLDLGTIIQSVMKTSRLVILEEAWKTCSFGAEIAARVAEEAFDFLDAAPLRISGLDVPMPYAKNLERRAVPTAESATKRILQWLD